MIGGVDDVKADALAPGEIAEARELGVRFLGARDDVVSLYSGMNVYGLASHREGYPRSAMEAAAMGLPIVATDIRGCREVVTPEVNGLLVPRRDARSLAAAIAAIADDEGGRRRMGAAGRQIALQHFNQQRCIDITLGVYDRMLAERGFSRGTRIA